jgi:hypothetical protein
MPQKRTIKRARADRLLASHHQRRPANLYAKRSIRSDVAGTAHDRRGKQLPLGFLRRGERASSYHRQNTEASRRVRVEAPNTRMRPARENARSVGAHEFRGPYRARSSARSEVLPHTQRCRGMRAQPLRGALPRNDLHRLGRPRTQKDVPGALPPPKRQREHGPVARLMCQLLRGKFGCVSNQHRPCISDPERQVAVLVESADVSP